MKMTFLEAPVPLIKTYTSTTKNNYPQVRDFTSHEANPQSLAEFEVYLQMHAKHGHCLLKGHLDRPIIQESRAGHTDAQATTQSICLDIDGINSIPTIDQLLTIIGLGDVSYILQWSSSYGVNNNYDLRAHVFMWLQHPAYPFQLKNWLKALNLEHFSKDLQLTKSHVALKWGLDTSTCQNDKLLYIAPPVCDPPEINTFTGERIQLVTKSEERADLSGIHTLNQAVIRQDEVTEINRLRKDSGLKSRAESKFKERMDGGVLYAPNPTECDVTEVKTERGFTYLNLNGGDSWGYYHPEEDPEYIYNFKGEPTYRTEDLIPSYLDNIRKTKLKDTKSAHSTKLFLGFRDFRTAAYWNGWYCTAENKITLAPAKSEKQIMDFFTEYGQPEPDHVAIWHRQYLPTKPPLDITRKIVNIFEPSEYMKQTETPNTDLAGLPTPIIDHLLNHVMGPELVPHFINWLAHVYQKRTLPKTAWVLHGIQGTGKGILFYHVLRPLLGEGNAAQHRMETLKESFNPYMEESLLVVIDEAEVSESGKQNAIMANLKNWITEQRVTIRRMRTDVYDVDNHVGFIFCSNMPDPVVIGPSDRRFNVGEFQRQPYQPTDSDLFSIEQDELIRFAHKLQLHNIDAAAVRTPKMTKAKMDIIHTSMTSAEELALALREGDMEELLECMPGSAPKYNVIEAKEYEALVFNLVQTRRTNLTRDEVHTLFDYAVGNIPQSAKKFTSYLRHKDIEIKPISVNGKIQRGYQMTEWKQDEAWFNERQDELEAILETGKRLPPGTVVPIK
jgi:hypothetical protein